MNVPTLYEHEDVDNDLSFKEKPGATEEWILTFCAWLIVILVWAAAMEAYIEW